MSEVRPSPFHALVHRCSSVAGANPFPGSGRYRFGKESRMPSSGNARPSLPRRLREVVANNAVVRPGPRRARGSVVTRRQDQFAFLRRGGSCFTSRTRKWQSDPNAPPGVTIATLATRSEYFTLQRMASKLENLEEVKACSKLGVCFQTEGFRIRSKHSRFNLSGFTRNCEASSSRARVETY